MEFSRQEYWSMLPFLTSGDLPNPETKPTSLVSLALAGRFFSTVALESPALEYINSFGDATQQRLMVWPAPVGPDILSGNLQGQTIFTIILRHYLPSSLAEHLY